MWSADSNNAYYPVMITDSTIRETFQNSSAMCYKMLRLSDGHRVKECQYWVLFRGDSAFVLRDGRYIHADKEDIQSPPQAITPPSHDWISQPIIGAVTCDVKFLNTP